MDSPTVEPDVSILALLSVNLRKGVGIIIVAMFLDFSY
jgi:hypothetical protein